ncbi:MAG: sensor histidine kinase [Deltaproteobacteria bacterium]|nr:MAG: sensor histidine kinase [Deltaproteobacteria bacterium]
MSIAKWIAEAHHGTIDVQSRSGQGSTFTLTFPLCPENLNASVAGAEPAMGKPPFKASEGG